MLRKISAGLALALSLGVAAHADPFDARRAADLASVVTSHGASGELKKGDDGKLYFDGQAGQTFFAVNFQDCDEDRSLCKTALFSAWWTSKKVTADQVNAWNRWTLYCPAYLDTDQTPNLWYTLAVSAHTDPGDLADVVSTWMGCLSDFDSFVGDPEAFLKRVKPEPPPPPPPPAPPAGGRH